MQGLFRRAAASFVAVCLLVPQSPGASTASVRHGAPRTTSVALASPPQRIAVKEPVRVKPVLPPLNAMRAKIVPGIRAHGIPVNGPPMLRPSEVDHARTAGRSRVIQSATAQRLLPAGVTVPQTPSAGTRPGTRHTMSLPSDPSASGSGINPWWRYQEQNVPGGGHLMVNVGTGNLLLQDDDMTVPHKGIALAFRRMYNSQNSAATTPNYFGNWQSLYGNGWTSTFDAHFVKISASLVAIYDVDGARYDYAIPTGTTYSAGTTLPAATAGQHATLTFDGVCGWLWTKKTGTTYYFYGTNPTLSCPTLSGAVGGYAGRLRQIIGRNSNTYITFAYAWDNGNASTTGKISQITATTESGMTATLSFGDVNGRRLLQQIVYPDNSTSVSYGYDAQGNLGSVSRPPNNASGTRPLQTFNYQTIGNDSVIADISGPRYNASCIAGSCGSDGGALVVGFTGSSAVSSTVSWIDHVAAVNPLIADGTNSPLQSGYSASAYGFLIEYYGTGSTTPTYRDTDGHITNWIVDGSGRPTQTQECTVSANGQQCTDMSHWLVSNESWDASNNLVAEIDPRGNETDYAYDAGGNTIAVAAPVTTTTAGTFRPTRLLDYDSNNNVIAYCDEKASHASGGRGDWSNAGPPAAGEPDALCATNGSAAHEAFSYTVTPSEPFGELTNLRSPLGYNRTVGYDAAQQAGADFGLPTTVTGDAIVQSDGTRTPFQKMTYDAAGNLICSSSDGNDPTTTAVLVYDSLNRVTAIGDPDDSTVTNGSCTKTPGIAGSAIASRTTYFADGEVAATQTPAEASAGVSTQFRYDLDGNVTSEQRHFTPGAGPTLKWYDGADRLVEVQQPADSVNDFYTFPWTTRYLYDLTQGGTVTIASSAPYRAYGGLFKTQEQLPSGVATPQWSEAGTSIGASNPTWQDTAGAAFDALDRPVTAFRNTGTSLMPVTNTYDAPGSAGLLSQKCNANSECQTFTYDPRGAVSRSDFNVPTSSTQTFSFDEDGHMATGSNGAGSFNDVYDADGRKTARQEFTGTSSATIQYAYYTDGLRKSLDASSDSQSLPGILTYTYRPDGVLRQLGVAAAYTFSFSYTGGRRLTSRSDTTGQSPDTFTYTANTSPTSYGLAQSMASPGFYETGMTYNAEGGQLGGGFYAFNGSGFFPSHLVQAAYTTRGEVVVDTSGLRSPSAGSLYANGMRIQTERSSSSLKTAQFQFNAFQSVTNKTNSASTCSPPCTENDFTWSYGYDPAGRQITAAYESSGAGPTYTNTKAYDAEDHLRVQTLPYIRGYQRSLSYRWGPFGHPMQIGATSAVYYLSQPPTDFQYDTLVWDENGLLFTVNSAGQIDDLKVGGFADYVPGASNPLTVWDRDTNGQIYGCHTGGAASTVASSAFQDTTGSCGASSSFKGAGFGITGNPPVGRGGMLLIPKSDGINDGQNTFQGVRSYDPQAGVWTTPDAYYGDVHDPMSQKPYMWNHNNPYAFSDVSGFNYVTEPLFRDDDPSAVAASGFTLGRGPEGVTERAITIWRPEGDDGVEFYAGKRKPHDPPHPKSNIPNDIKQMIHQEVTQPRPPAGSRPISQTEWTRWHDQIKGWVQNTARQKTRIDRQDNVWVENRDGSWTNKGHVGNMYMPDKKN